MEKLENSSEENESGFDWMEKLKKQIEFSDEKLDLALKHLENTEVRLQKLMDLLMNTDFDDLASIKRDIEEAKEDIQEVQSLVNGTKKINSMVKERQERSISLMKIFHDQLEEEQQIDELTKLGSKKYFEHIWGRFIEERKKFFVVFIDLNDLTNINNKYWHDAGDSVLIDFSKDLSNVLWKEKNTAFRIHGDEFMVISEDNLETITHKMSTLVEWLDRRHYKIIIWTNVVHIAATFAYWISERKGCDDLRSLKVKSEKKMYNHKARMKDDNKYKFGDDEKNKDV